MMNKHRRRSRRGSVADRLAAFALFNCATALVKLGLVLFCINLRNFEGTTVCRQKKYNLTYNQGKPTCKRAVRVAVMVVTEDPESIDTINVQISYYLKKISQLFAIKSYDV